MQGATKRKVVGYIRVSTTMQKEEGISLSTQDERIRQWCYIKGHEFVRMYADEGLTAGTMQRPALQAMLHDIGEGYIICVAELSRLSRSGPDALNILEHIKSRRAYLVSLVPDIDFTTPIGEMMYGILMLFHQLERKQVIERVKINMAALSKQNRLRSKAPYGFRFVSKETPLAPVPEQQAVISDVVQLYRSGSNYNFIAKHLNDKGFHSTLGLNKKKPIPNQKFSSVGIKRILMDHGELLTEFKHQTRYIGVRKANLDAYVNDGAAADKKADQPTPE